MPPIPHNPELQSRIFCYAHDAPKCPKLTVMEACPQFLDYPLSHIGTHLIALYSLNNNVAYFDNFGAEQSSKECLNTKTWQTFFTK